MWISTWFQSGMSLEHLDNCPRRIWRWIQNSRRKTMYGQSF